MLIRDERLIISFQDSKKYEIHGRKETEEEEREGRKETPHSAIEPSCAGFFIRACYRIGKI